MENSFSGKSKNKLKVFVMICGCFIAVTAYAIGSPRNLENTKINELSSIRTDQGADLAKAMKCLSCHAVATKVIGPSFKDVSKKYAGQKDASAKLVQKVMKGSRGTWGAVSMPANVQVSNAEAQTLVKWILALK